VTETRIPDEDPMEPVAEEFLERFRRGERPSVTEFKDRYPHLADRIDVLLPALAEIELLGEDDSLASGQRARSTPPQRLADYRIIREIGRGGMGVVYEAIQESLGRPVALKLLSDRTSLQPAHRERFRQEARSAARLHHSNIVPVYGVGEDKGYLYFAMQLIDGRGLDVVLEHLRRLRRSGQGPSALTGRRTPGLSTTIAIPANGCDGAESIARSLTFPHNKLPSRAAPLQSIGTDAAGTANAYGTTAEVAGINTGLSSGTEWTYFREVVRIGLQAAEALAHAHARGIVHRDIKPSNLLLDANGTVWLTDFGLAKTEDAEDLTRTGDVVGTLRYLAPERFEGKADARSDVYALGATLYELLTLRPPFEETNRARLVERVLHESPVAPRKLESAVPRDVETIVIKALAKEPEARYVTAEQMAEDLRRFLADRPIRARRTATWERAARWCRRNPLAGALGGTVAVLITAIAVGSTIAALRLETALNASRLLSASLTRDRGLALCEQGDIDRGLLWLVRSLKAADVPGGHDLDRLVRADLSSWSRRVHHLHGRFEQSGFVRSVALSPDGKTLLTGSDDNTAQLWDAASGRRLGPPLIHRGPVVRVALGADGRTLVTLVKDGRAIVWDRATNPPRGIELPHPGAVLAVDLGPDGTTVVTAAADGSARLWNATSRESVGLPMKHGGPIYAVAFDAVGQRILTGSDDHTARVWNARTGEPLTPPLYHEGKVRKVAFGARGQLAATVSDDLTVLVWDCQTARPVGRPMRHEVHIEDVAFSAASDTIVTASRDARARLWDARTGSLRGPDLHHLGPIMAVAISRDGRVVLTGSKDSTANVWDSATGNPLGAAIPHEGQVFALALSADGATALVAGNAPAACLWKLQHASTAIATLPHEEWICSMALSPDRRLVATCAEGHVRLCETLTGRAVGPALPHRELVRAAAFSSDGKMLATGDEDGTAQIWEVNTGRPIGPPLAHDCEVFSTAFSQDSQWLLTGTSSGVIHLWETHTGKCIKSRAHHKGPVFAMAFSPKGERFISSGGDHAPQLWSSRSFEPLGPPLHHPGIVWAAVFSPDGRVAATGGTDRSIRLWDGHRGTPLGMPLAERQPIRTLEFSANGRTLFVGGLLAASRFWDMATRKPIGASLGHKYAAYAARFDPSGSSVIVGLEEETIAVLDVPVPLGGSASRIEHWANTITGLKLDGEGGAETLNSPEWRREYLRLERMGGPPDR
jgi:WD40 repeat protein/serine/threonine protein kinase